MLPGKPWPTFLRAGDVVGIWAPASAPKETEVQAGVAVLRQAGFQVVSASNLTRKRGYLAGEDGERLRGLFDLLEAGARSLWAVRGGYGVMRLLHSFPWETLRGWDGWIIGYSDVTALHCAALQRFPRATVHGPMVVGLGRSEEATKRILGLVQGKMPRPVFRFGQKAVLRAGLASGPLVGGNLSVLTSLLGTDFEPPWEGAILALEDVGEPGYRLDRALTQLGLSGRLWRINGLVLGKFARCAAGEPESRRLLAERLLSLTPEGCPVVMGLPFGHVGRNFAFPLGKIVTLDTHRGVVTMEE